MLVGRIDRHNFATFQWKSMYSVKIESIKEFITPEIIAPCKEILTIVDFFGLTQFSNVEVILRNCINLKTIRASHLILENLSPPEEDVSVAKLTKLSFFGSGALSSHEIAFLQYFTDKIQTPVIKSLCFEENMFYRHLPQANLDVFPEGNYVVGKFIAKNSSSLKCITLERTPIILKANSNTIEKLSSLQLKEFTCNLALSSTARGSSCTGYENILKHQCQLQSLVINARGLRSVPPSNVDCFYDSIEKCAGTLKTIHFDSISAFGGDDRELNNDTPEIAHDFSLYKNCHQLQYLYIGVSIYHRVSLYHLVPGSLRNVYYVPLSIQTVFLVFDHFDEIERENFVGRLPQLINLRSFSCKGNREMPFRVNFDWIHCLIQLPKLRYFLFTGCLIEDFANVRQFVMSSPELSEVMEVAPDCCAFTSWRNT